MTLENVLPQTIKSFIIYICYNFEWNIKHCKMDFSLKKKKKEENRLDWKCYWQRTKALMSALSRSETVHYLNVNGIREFNVSISGSSNFIDGLGLAKAKGRPSPDFNWTIGSFQSVYKTITVWYHWRRGFKVLFSEKRIRRKILTHRQKFILGVSWQKWNF